MIWIAKRQIEDCEERCCDLAATRHTATSPRIYADAILKTLDFLCESIHVRRTSVEPRPIASGVGHLPKIEQRLRQIMKPNFREHTGHSRWILIACVVILLPVCPSVVVSPAGSGNLRSGKTKDSKVLNVQSEVEPDFAKRVSP